MQPAVCVLSEPESLEDADAGRAGHTGLSSVVRARFERPALHLLVDHELQRAVAYAGRCAGDEPALTLVAGYRAKSAGRACYAESAPQVKTKTDQKRRTHSRAHGALRASWVAR